MFYNQVRNVQGGGSGKTFVFLPALNATYDKFILQFGAASGLTAADLTEIRIIANDGEIFKDTATYLDTRQAYHTIDTDTAEVTIDFTEPHARGGAAEQLLSSIPANLLKNLRIEVDVANNQGVGEDFTQMNCYAEYRGPTKNPFILKRRMFNWSASGAGSFDIALPYGGSGGIIKRIWLHGGSVTAAVLRIGNRDALNFGAIALLQRVQVRNGKTIQANTDVLDLVVDGNLQGALNTVGAAQPILTLTTSQAQAYKIYVDFIDPLNRTIA